MSPSNPPTSLGELDRALAEWDRRLQRLDENLLALEEEPTYRIMTTRSARVSGRTREAFERTRAALEQLFEERGMLAEVIDRARDLRKQIGFFGAAEKIEAAGRLLFGPSILLAQRSAAIEERSLFGELTVDDTITPLAFIARMTTRFDQAKHALAEVQAAWAAIEPLLATLENDSVHLAQRAALPGLAPALAAEGGIAAGRFEDERAEVARLRGEVMTDPLGARSKLVATEARLATLSLVLDEITARHLHVHASLAHAEHRLTLLEQTWEEASLARASCARDFVGGEVNLPPALEAEALSTLRGRRHQLVETARQGHLAAATLGLSRWHALLDADLALTVRGLEEAKAMVLRREELRGRFSARRAQAAVLRERADGARSSNADLETLARAVDIHLAQHPTALEELANALGAYEVEVVHLARSLRR